MAYAASWMQKMFQLKSIDLKSKPYIDLTLDVMKQFGLKVPENRNYEEFYFHNEPLTVLTTQDSTTIL